MSVHQQIKAEWKKLVDHSLVLNMDPYSFISEKLGVDRITVKTVLLNEVMVFSPSFINTKNFYPKTKEFTTDKPIHFDYGRMEESVFVLTEPTGTCLTFSSSQVKMLLTYFARDSLIPFVAPKSSYLCSTFGQIINHLESVGVERVEKTVSNNQSE